MRNWLTHQYRVYPTLFFFFLFSAGVALAWFARLSLPPLVVLIPTIFLFIVAWIFHRYAPALFVFAMAPLVVMLGLSSGLGRLTLFDPNHLINHRLAEIEAIDGFIAEAHYQKDGKHRYLLQCRRVQVDSGFREAQGKVMVFQGRYEQKLSYGDWLHIASRPFKPALPSNPGDFNYRRYLHWKGVHHQLYLGDDNVRLMKRAKGGSSWKRTLVLPLRAYIRSTIDRYFPPPTRDVLQALLLGERQNLEVNVTEQFRRTGIVHVLAISGLHVGFIVLILTTVLSFFRLPFHLRTIAAVAGLVLFVALVNFKAPVLRATLMVVFYFLGRLSERHIRPLNTVAAAGLLILIFDPLQLLMPGFQFSFAAVFAILYGYPRFNALVPQMSGETRRKRVFNQWIRQPVLVSAAAVLGTLPLTWSYYGVFQSGALLANIIIIPLIGMFVIGAFIFLFLSALPFFAITASAFLLHHFFLLISAVIALMAKFPFMQFHLPAPSILQIILITTLILFLFNWRLRMARILFAGGLSFLLLLAMPLTPAGSGQLRILHLNVGQGDAALIRFPNGETMLVDAGDLKRGFDAGDHYVRPVLNYYDIERLKYLVGSHAHSDHIGGLISLMQTVEVDTLVLPQYEARSVVYHRLIKQAHRLHIPVRWKRRGEQLYVDPHTRVYILHPTGSFCSAANYSGEEVNNSSLVLKILYGETAVLLTGDLEKSAEPALSNYNGFLNSTVLKVGHHGSKTSTTLPLLQKVDPRFAVISVGRYNRFFHPSHRTVKRLLQYPVPVLRTDRLGGIQFVSDGRRMSFENWR